MGMPIAVHSHQVVGDVAVFDTDRSITGQDGAAFERDTLDGGFPGRLAALLFSADPNVDHVWVASSQVVVRRSGGWDGAAAGATAGRISGFFVHYADS